MRLWSRPLLFGSGLEQYDEVIGLANQYLRQSGSWDLLNGPASKLALAIHETFDVNRRNGTVGGGIQVATIDNQAGYRVLTMKFIEDSKSGQPLVSDITTSPLRADAIRDTKGPPS